MKFIPSNMYIVLKWSLSNENSFFLQILQLNHIKTNLRVNCPILEHCWLGLGVRAKVPGLHHHVGEGGGGEGDGEVELTKEGGHLAPRHQPPVRVLYQHVSREDKKIIIQYMLCSTEDYYVVYLRSIWASKVTVLTVL